MGNVILFTNTFLSYLLLLVIIVVIAGVGVFIGIKMRKNKDSKMETAQASDGTKSGS
ncbi:MAG: hypothetical protein K2P13_01530 [Lachnospiraceae bacterium]|nr:hypothetical protein [Lachnospiraceae bacterium]MDE6975675.1 hypothetical protein [Lachnospiraceae bacterium]